MATARLPSVSTFGVAPPTQKSIYLMKIPSSLGSLKSKTKAFGLKVKLDFRASAMAYKVKLIGPNGAESEFEAPEDAYILDSAESAGIELPCWSMLNLCGEACLWRRGLV